MIDERFTGDKHFWSAVCVDRPRKPKNLIDNIEKYAPEGSFTEDEKITFLSDLTGIFPMSKVITPDVQRRVDEYCAPPLSEYDHDLGYAWCVPRSVTQKKSKTGKNFYVVEVVDSNSVVTKIRCWNVVTETKQVWDQRTKRMVIRERDELFINRPYIVKPRYNGDWGFSTYGMLKNSWFLLG